MSSVQSHYAQIPYQARFLYATTSDSGFTKAQLTTVLAAQKSNIIGFDGTILNVKTTAVHDALLTPGTGITAQDVYKDMGKKIYVQVNGQMHAIYTFCQNVGVNGDDVVGLLTEGVPNTPNVYVCTWASTGGGNQTTLARTG